MEIIPHEEKTHLETNAPGIGFVGGIYSHVRRLARSNHSHPRCGKAGLYDPACRTARPALQ